MPSRGWIQAIIALVAALMIGLSAITGDSIDEQGLRWLSIVGGAVTLLLLAFEQLLWRLPGIRYLCELFRHPVIHGTWRGTLAYQRDADDNPGETEIYMAIRQTFSTVSVRCYFPKTEAESWSLAARLVPNDHRHDLRYIYQQQAPAPARGENRPTQGACDLAVAGRPVRSLVGSYYSERGGSGQIRLFSRSRKLAGSLSEAEPLEYS
jgi:SMODS-associating 2TM, beta-strand rich effector domain